MVSLRLGVALGRRGRGAFIEVARALRRFHSRRDTSEDHLVVFLNVCGQVPEMVQIAANVEHIWSTVGN